MKDKTKARLLGCLSGAALAVVLIAPAAASWHGLVTAGRDLFGLQGGWEYVVPLTLDGAALYAATLAMRSVLAGDSAFFARLLTTAYALAAASFQFAHESRVPAALFFAGASVSSVLLWDVTLRALRRNQLRAAGLVERPLPRWRLLRWVVAPVETGRAWRVAVIDGISDPQEALEIARAQHRARTGSIQQITAERITENNTEHHIEEVNDGSGDGQEVHGSEGSAGTDRLRARPGLADQGSDRGGRDGWRLDRLVPERGQLADHLHQDRVLTLAGLSQASKADALRAAFDMLGRRDIPGALAWLRDNHGIEVDRSYAYTVKWEPKRSALRVVGGEQS